MSIEGRVLVIDDDDDTCAVTAEILELGGFEVRLASSGARGIAEACAFQPEVALIDIGMPKVDGFTVATGIRNLARIRQPILIAYTGYQCNTIMRTVDCKVFDAFLQKPASIEALIGLICSLKSRAILHFDPV